MHLEAPGPAARGSAATLPSSCTPSPARVWATASNPLGAWSCGLRCPPQWQKCAIQVQYRVMVLLLEAIFEECAEEIGKGASRDALESEAAPEAVRQAVGGGYQSGWGRLLSVTNAIEAGTWCLGDSGWA